MWSKVDNQPLTSSNIRDHFVQYNNYFSFSNTSVLTIKFSPMNSYPTPKTRNIYQQFDFIVLFLAFQNCSYVTKKHVSRREISVTMFIIPIEQDRIRILRTRIIKLKQHTHTLHTNTNK